ncbi:hypothetical protein E4U39_003847, partial [Claviceps sp. Clav50 group G5]
MPLIRRREEQTQQRQDQQRAKAAGINGIDTMQVRGTHSDEPPSLRLPAKPVKRCGCGGFVGAVTVDW